MRAASGPGVSLVAVLLAFPLLACADPASGSAPAGARAPPAPVSGPTNDPFRIRDALRNASEAEVAEVIAREGLVPPDELEELVKWKRFKGGAVDLFQANLFGDPRREAILQLRFNQAVYILAFFSQEGGAWRLLPDPILIDGSNFLPCEPHPACKGFFCFEFAELRRKGENAVVGHFYGGECRGGFHLSTDEGMAIWQVTREGARKVHSVTLQALHLQFPMGAPVEHIDKKYSFVPSGKDKFPKQLLVEETLYDLSEFVRATQELREEQYADFAARHPGGVKDLGRTGKTTRKTIPLEFAP